MKRGREKVMEECRKVTERERERQEGGVGKGEDGCEGQLQGEWRRGERGGNKGRGEGGSVERLRKGVWEWLRR